MTRPIRDLDVPLPVLEQRIADLAEQAPTTQPDTTPEEGS